MIAGILGTGTTGTELGSKLLSAFLERAGSWVDAVRVDRSPSLAEDAVTANDGLVAGTLVATQTGWRQVEHLRPGDLVVTFDNGPQPLRATQRCRLSAGATPRAAWPLHLPAGVLDNRRDLILLPEQALLIESDLAEDLYGDPFVLVTAASLSDVAGVTRVQPDPGLDAILLEFEGDEIVYAEGMVLAHCPRRSPTLVITVDELIHAGRPQLYRQLPRAQGRALFADLAPA